MSTIPSAWMTPEVGMEERILLVEDDPRMAVRQRGHLEEADYRVTIAPSGEVALQEIEEEKFHLVLMDIDLGEGIDGVDTAKRILDLQALPIVFVSDHDEDDLVTRIEEVPSYGHITKDAGAAALQATVSVALRLFGASDSETDASHALAIDRKQFSQVIETVSDIVFMADSLGKITEVNRTFVETFGEIREPLGTYVTDLFGISFLDPSLASVGKKVRPIEVLCRDMRGHQRTLKITCTQVSVSGKPGLLCVAEDQAPSKEPETEFGSILPIMHEGCALLKIEHDAAGKPIDFRLQDINVAFGRLTGRDRSIIGMSAGEVFSEATNLWTAALDEETLEGELAQIEVDASIFGTPLRTRVYRLNQNQLVVTLNVLSEEAANHIQLNRLSRLLGAFRRATEILKSGESAVEIVKKTCQELVQGQGYLLARCCIVGTDGEVVLNVQADRGRSSLRDLGLTRGNLTGCDQEVLKAQGHQDVSVPGGMCGECPFAGQHQACRSLRRLLRHKDRLFGVLTVVENVEVSPEVWEEELFDELAKEVSYTLSSLETEEKLRQSETFYRNLFDTMAEGVIYQSRDGRITSANPAACRILKVDQDVLIDKSPLEPYCDSIRIDGSRLSGEDHPGMVALRTGEPVRDSIVGIRYEDHSTRWLRVNAIPQFRPGQEAPYQVFTTFNDQTEQIQSQKKAAELLERDKILMHEIQHRVKNNLLMVQALLKLQADTAIGEETKEALKDTRSRVASMALLYERLHATQSVDKVSSKEYLESLVYQILATLTPISGTRLEIADVELSVSEALPLGIILNEAITNAVKHGAELTPELKLAIAFRQEEDGLVLDIWDSGPGFDTATTAKGFGLTLIAAMAGQLDGELQIRATAGTRISVVAPVNRW